MKFYCIIHEGRCGSTALASILEQHPEITHFNEILTEKSWISRDFVGSEWEARRDSASIRLADLVDFVRILPDTLKAKKKQTCSHIGFEIKLNQLSRFQLGCSLEKLVETLESGCEGIRLVFLTRKNILRRHVSSLRCIYNNVSHSEDLNKVNFNKVTISQHNTRDWSYDYELCHASILEMIETSESNRISVRDFALNHRSLYMEYENFEKDILSGASRIFDYLGLSAIHVSSPFLKTGDKPLQELVENYSEIRELLVSSKWEWMLD